jgi:hypothetical protein
MRSPKAVASRSGTDAAYPKRSRSAGTTTSRMESAPARARSNVPTSGMGAPVPRFQAARRSDLTPPSRRELTGAAKDSLRLARRLRAQKPAERSGVNGTEVNRSATPRSSRVLRVCQPNDLGFSCGRYQTIARAWSARPKSWYSTTTSKRRLRRTEARQLQTLSYAASALVPRIRPRSSLDVRCHPLRKWCWQSVFATRSLQAGR